MNVYGDSRLNQEMPMSGRKNTQFRRNYLVKCPCPNCSKDSEHSFSRVQKGAQLVCPHCSTLFKTAQKF
ncbi:YnfU family zinc-binding protein [Enterobacter ludwigii]|uniref:YnfU family zinc-binding protein n=1 Tax=Enterobacter ludwigii TaxID=299767 RepID=UPI003F71F242